MKIVIVDDEINYINQIEEVLLEHFSDKKLDIQKYDSVNPLMNQDTSEIDICFLDIEIRDGNGINLANYIAKINKRVIIFFVTSHSHYISDAMDCEPFQYILKPIDVGVLVKKIQRAFEKYLKDRAVLETSRLGQKTKVNIFDISYIEYFHRLCLIHLSTGKSIECSNAFGELTAKLKEYNIVKCKKSFLVNLDDIESLKSNEVKLKSGQVLSISRNYKKEFEEAFARYMSEVKV
ncbi:MAG: LytTR family DNA-binding domain-containing protein [Bacillota bacterium]